MDTLLEAGSVVCDTRTDTKYVIRRPRAQRPHEALVADYPHGDGDYGYPCGDADCRCVGEVASATPRRYGLPASLKYSDTNQRYAEMAEVLRGRTGHRQIDCLQAVRATKDVESAINWLSMHTKYRPLYRARD